MCVLPLVGRAGRVALVSACTPLTAPSVVGHCESRDLATTLLCVQVSPLTPPLLPPSCTRPALSWTLPHPYKTHLTPFLRHLANFWPLGLFSTRTLQEGICLQSRLIPSIIRDVMAFSGSSSSRQEGRLLTLETIVLQDNGSVQIKAVKTNRVTDNCGYSSVSQCLLNLVC